MKQYRKPDKVLRKIFWLSLIVSIVIVGRLYHLQIIKANDLQEKVAEQRVKPKLDYPERGEMLDRHGKTLAFSEMSYDIAVYPKFIDTEEKKEKVAKILTDNLKIKHKDVMKAINKKNSKGEPAEWASVAKDVDYLTMKKIREVNDGSIEMVQRPRRKYPNGELGSSFLGFVNLNKDPMAGLELSLNDFLSGTPGYTIAERSRSGKVIPVGYENISSPVDGEKVTLTIDAYMQLILETKLKEGMERVKAKGIHGLIMNPKNGEILAMASFPSFNGNDYMKYDPKTWNNNIGAFTYEPGSVMKPVIMGLALENGTIDESFTSQTGHITVGPHTISDWNGYGFGVLDLRNIIHHSSNVGMVKISDTMTAKQVYEGLTRFGFGQKTGIEMPLEEVGIMPTQEELEKRIRKATVSFGQGISTTPIMMAKAHGQIANGGYVITPHLVKKVEDDFGNIIYQHEEKEQQRVWSEKTNAIIKDYLRTNTLEGSGPSGKLEGYQSGSKTGTAQKAENGAYGSDIITSYVGFAPWENPEFVMLISVDSPDQSIARFGSTAAGPIFKAVGEELLAYTNAPKEGEQKEEVKMSVPDVTWMLFEDAEKLLKEEIKDVIVKNSGNNEVVVDQKYRFKNNKLYVTLITRKIIQKDDMYVPYLNGKTKEDAQMLLKKYPLEVKFHGNGKVVEQSLKVGRKKIEKEITLWLK